MLEEIVKLQHIFSWKIEVKWISTEQTFLRERELSQSVTIFLCPLDH